MMDEQDDLQLDDGHNLLYNKSASYILLPSAIKITRIYK